MVSRNIIHSFIHYVDVDNLSYLPKDSIEVAVKRIIFDTSDIDGTGSILALKSNICKESVYNDRFENILCIFQVRNKHHVESKSPTYFPSGREILSNCDFTIIDLKNR